MRGIKKRDAWLAIVYWGFAVFVAVGEVGAAPETIQRQIDRYRETYAALERNLDPAIPDKIAIRNAEKLGKQRAELETRLRALLVKERGATVVAIVNEIERHKASEQRLQYASRLMELLFLKDRCGVMLKLLTDRTASAQLRVKVLSHIAFLSTYVDGKTRERFGLADDQVKGLLARLVREDGSDFPEIRKTVMDILNGVIKSQGLQDRALAVELRRTSG